MFSRIQSPLSSYWPFKLLEKERLSQGPRSNFEIGEVGGGGTISDSIFGGGGAQNTFSY